MTHDSIGHLKTLCMSVLSQSDGVESEWKRYSSPLGVEKTYESSLTTYWKCAYDVVIPYLWCRNCSGDPHEPCSCENWKKWQEKVAEVKPEDCK